MRDFTTFSSCIGHDKFHASCLTACLGLSLISLHYVNTANRFVERFQNGFGSHLTKRFWDAFTLLTLGIEIIQVKEPCRTFGHVLRLSKHGISESGSIVCVL